jgi:hypothetical protein
MGGLFYQREAHHVVDYNLYELEGCKEQFRGPRMALNSGKFVAYVGAAQTFGTFCRFPFPALVAERTGLAYANLGIGGAGPGRFLQDDCLLRIINDARLAVVQVMSGRSAPCRIFETMAGSSTLRRLDKTPSEWMWAEPAWAEVFKDFSRDEIASLIADTRRCWVELMVELLGRISIPKILFWISARSPQFEFSLDDANSALGPFPHFVDARMMEAVKTHADEYVEAISSRGLPQQLYNRHCGESAAIKRPNRECSDNSHYPSPQMHVDFAEALTPVIERTLRVSSAPRRAGETPSTIAAPLPERNVIVLLCHERSGSHYFKELISSHPSLEATAEVCNYAATQSHYKLGYFRFRNSLFLQRPELMAPTLENMQEILDMYFSFIRSCATKNFILLDLKYGHVPNFNGFWSASGWPPAFMGYLKSRDIPVVHLYRRNVFEAVASSLRANKTKVWNAAKKDTVGDISLRIDPKMMFFRLSGWAHEICAWRYYLRALRHCEVTYEDLCLPADLRNAHLNRIVSFLGQSTDWTPKSTLSKVSPDVATYVINYDELRTLAERFSDVEVLES